MELSVVILLVAVLPLSLEQRDFKQPCSYGVDIILVIDTSGNNVPGDDTLGSLKRGLSELVEIHDIGFGRDQARFAMCVYGSDAREVLRLDDDRRQNLESIKTRIGNSPFTGFRRMGGTNSLHAGVACGIRASNTSIPGRQKLMVLMLASDPDPQTLPWTNGNITEAQDQVYISVIAIGNRVTNSALLRSFASADKAFTRMFTLRGFVADAERTAPSSFASICPIDLTTTTTTTTTPPPGFGSPCDNCVIINGIGYAATDDCFSYFQCILREDETWLEFRRPVSVGTFWNQAMVTGSDPRDANCAFDPCATRDNGAVIGGYNNCRAKITCQDGRTAAVECCPGGEGLVNGRCGFDPSCNDPCDPQDTTPSSCYLSPDVDGNVNRFMANDGDFSMSMPCPIGTQYSDSICGCVHSDGPIPVRECREHPEVDLQFGPGGQVFDNSRNRYSITTENFSTRETSPGSNIYVGVFQNATRVRISNANSGLKSEITIKVIYTPTRAVANAAVVADAECLGTIRTISVIDDGGVTRGFVRTVPDDTVIVDNPALPGRREVVMQYTGEDLVVDTNGRIESSPAGVLMSGTPFCDGLKLGRGKGLNDFVGEIERFQLFKCLGDGPESFRGN